MQSGIATTGCLTHQSGRQRTPLSCIIKQIRVLEYHMAYVQPEQHTVHGLLLAAHQQSTGRSHTNEICSTSNQGCQCRDPRPCQRLGGETGPKAVGGSFHPGAGNGRSLARHNATRPGASLGTIVHVRYELYEAACFLRGRKTIWRSHKAHQRSVVLVVQQSIQGDRLSTSRHGLVSQATWSS